MDPRARISKVFGEHACFHLVCPIEEHFKGTKFSDSAACSLLLAETQTRFSK